MCRRLFPLFELNDFSVTFIVVVVPVVCDMRFKGSQLSLPFLAACRKDVVHYRTWLLCVHVTGPRTADWQKLAR